MPKYSFECPECNVRFERNLKIGEHTTHKCPSCEGLAPRVFEGEGFGFSFVDQKSGSGAANSGVHDLDYPTADKIVGRSAAKRWEMYEQRDAVKNQAREKGETHALIRHTGREGDHIDYEPMSDTGRNARRTLAKEALKAAKEGRPDQK